MNPAIDPVIWIRPSFCSRMSAQFLDQIERSGDVCLLHPSPVLGILIEETSTEPTPRIRHQRVDRPTTGLHLVSTVERSACTARTSVPCF